MPALRDLDLRHNPAAALYVKDETVQVAFATTTGVLVSREGPNHYAVGDALITSGQNERWSVTRERFEAKYVAVAPTVAGSDGAYRARPVPVLALQMSEPFTLARRAGGDLLGGVAGDWVLQYAPGDHGVIVQDRFARVYRPYQPA